MAQGISGFGKFLREVVSGKKTPITVGEVMFGRTPNQIPLFSTVPISELMTRFTGPELGAAAVHAQPEGREVQCTVCCESWGDRHQRADGAALSLYDQTKTGMQCGDPVADVFGVVSYRNGCLLSVADGVNWGEKPRLAARCAIHGSLGYLEESLSTARSTQDIMTLLLKSFDHAHRLIIQENGTLTTLVTCCTFQLHDGRWAVCAVNVGDSFAYIYSLTTGRVREVTRYSHEGERDMREAGGTLGPADGYNPDLGNLTCSFTFVEPGEILFATSDGVYDNFDPVVLKRASPIRDEGTTLPYMSQSERDSAGLKHMGCALGREMPSGPVRTASDVTMVLLRHVVAQTEAKRRCYEELIDNNKQELASRSRMLPGKLDHATVAAVQVGIFPENSVGPPAAVAAVPSEVGV